MRLEIVNFFEYDSPLLRYARNFVSQYGEDGILEHIIDALKPAHSYCVEFGAWDGKLFSNCHNLIKNHGWAGLMIEGSAEKFVDLAATYAGNMKVICANRFVNYEGEDRLDTIFDEESVPDAFGVLSIDIDGNDYYVWQSMTRYTPEIVVIEFNPTVPNDVIFVQDKSFAINHGCSLLALIELGKQKGYELAVATGTNGIFVRKDKFPLLGVSDNFIGKLHQPVENGRIFQGYDSSIHVVGMNTLIWNDDQPVSSADFQVLPEHKRVFNDRLKPE